MDAKIVLLILAGLVVLYVKLKDVFFKAKDIELTKEGQALNTEGNALQANITKIRDLQAQQANPGKLLSRDEIEEYWSKK